MKTKHFKCTDIVDQVHYKHGDLYGYNFHYFTCQNIVSITQTHFHVSLSCLILQNECEQIVPPQLLTLSQKDEAFELNPTGFT